MTLAPLPWMPAAAYGSAFKAGQPTLVVIHCTESDNGAGTAEALAGPNWFGGPKAGTSAHRIFDRDSGAEMVRRSTVAYHAGPNGNTYGLSYEMCGRAGWTAAQWRAPEQLAMLRRAAPYIADDLRAIAAAHGTDPRGITRWLSVAQVASHAMGLCTHNDIRLALGGTTHSDPGPNFPYAELLAYVTAELTGTTLEEPDVQLTDAIPNANPDTRAKTPQTTVSNLWQDTQANAFFAARGVAALAAQVQTLTARLEQVAAGAQQTQQTAAASGAVALADADVDRIAARVVQLLGGAIANG